MAISGNVTINVNDESLLGAASTLKERIRNMQESYANVMEIVQNTSRYWVGLAGDEHRSAFQEQQDEIDHILARLSEHPDDLLTIAGIYVEKEKEAEEISRTPVTEVIF
ncbi:MAG: hypothetical protein Q4D81_01280 [Eubacteriales bacterium]|nr:hypothetical protein [Eubacteriales bacterium]